MNYKEKKMNMRDYKKKGNYNIINHQFFRKNMKETKNIENWVNDVIDISIETENNNSEEKTINDKNILNNNSINNGLISKPKEYNIKDIHKLNIEDLVSYINEPKPKTNNKKKTKKKKRF